MNLNLPNVTYQKHKNSFKINHDHLTIQIELNNKELSETEKKTKEDQVECHNSAFEQGFV